MSSLLKLLDINLVGVILFINSDSNNSSFGELGLKKNRVWVNSDSNNSSFGKTAWTQKDSSLGKLENGLSILTGLRLD